MNGIRCPKCDLVNLTTATECHRCGTLFEDLPPTVYVSVPVEETFHARQFAAQAPQKYDTELGRRTYFWYHVYLGVMAAIYVLVAGLGVFLLSMQSSAETDQQGQEMMIMGAIYGVMGLAFAIIYIIALFLPPKPWNWIVGIVMMAIGMTSCCFLPALIPLLIYWIKPETQAFFGRK